jgi:hypothetical protein
MTQVDTGPLVDEFITDTAVRKSAAKALAHWITAGRLGALAKELGNLAAEMERVYTPPERRAEAERFEKLAKSVQDRELARTYREKAKAARSQMGETK